MFNSLNVNFSFRVFRTHRYSEEIYISLVCSFFSPSYIVDGALQGAQFNLGGDRVSGMDQKTIFHYAMVQQIYIFFQLLGYHIMIIILFYFGTVSTTSCRQLFILTVGSYILFTLSSFCLKLFISKISIPPKIKWSTHPLATVMVDPSLPTSKTEHSQ